MDSTSERYGPPEQVYVEFEWWDGPRVGIADIGGVPHRFRSVFDESGDDYLDTFIVWSIPPSELELEIAQWCIFVEWNTRFEAGLTDTHSHPGQGGIDARYDELTTRLARARDEAPASARRARAQLQPIEREQRYAPSGPAYALCWQVL